MRIDNVLGDGIGYVELLEWMGGDQQTVDRARVCYQSQEKSTPETDDRLLKKLVGSKPLHGTTMRGCVMTFDVLAPLFCVHQITRHVVGHEYHIADVAYIGADTFDIGSSFDQQSLRYTDNIQFYTPHNLDHDKLAMWESMIDYQIDIYNNLRSGGFAKQLARCALGPAVYSQFRWTCNLQACLDWGQKRLPGGGAQEETAKYAVAVMSLVEQYVAPKSIQYWKEQNA